MEHDDPRVLRSQAAVLDAAVALFVEGGLAGVTVDAVAARSGVAKTTIYRHWPNRQALLLDVFRHFDHAFPPPDPGATPLEWLRACVRALAATLATPEWQRALPALLDVARRVDEFAELHERVQPGSGSLWRAITAVIDNGDLPRGTVPGEVMVQLIGPLTAAAIFAPVLITPAFATALVDRVVAGYAAVP